MHRYMYGIPGHSCGTASTAAAHPAFGAPDQLMRPPRTHAPYVAHDSRGSGEVPSPHHWRTPLSTVGRKGARRKPPHNGAPGAGIPCAGSALKTPHKTPEPPARRAPSQPHAPAGRSARSAQGGQTGAGAHKAMGILSGPAPENRPVCFCIVDSFQPTSQGQAFLGQMPLYPPATQHGTDWRAHLRPTGTGHEAEAHFTGGASECHAS